MKEGGENDLTNLDGIATQNNILENEPENLKTPDFELMARHLVTVNEVKKYNRQLRKIDKGDGYTLDL